MERKLYILILLVLSGFNSKAVELAFPANLYHQVYQLDLDTTYSNQLDNAFSILAEDYGDFLYLIISGNESVFKNFKERHNRRLEAIDNSDSPEKVKSFSKAEIDLHWALVYWRFGEYLKSGFLIRRAYKNLIQLQSEYPGFAEVNKSLGLLHILLSAIPEEYDWLIKLFGFENNFERGFNELSNCANNANHFQLEAKLLLSYVNIFVLDKKKEGFEIIENLKLNEHKITSLSYIIFCHKAGENEKGLNEIYKDQWIFSPNYLKPLLSLLRGELHLKKLEYEDAILNYKDFLLSYKGIGFISNARLKLFYAYYLLGDDEKAESQMKKEIDGNSELIMSDKYAKSFFENAKTPDKELLKARLLYDGGYYTQAKNQVDLYPFKSKYDIEFQIEYYYRKARIEQSLNNLQISIESFKKCVELQADANYYFAPNACLQLGHIYHERNELEKAEYYFEKAMDYKKYAYKQSIEHQAKSALNALDSF